MPGFFVTLEGPEGAGKSTLLMALGRWLEATNRHSVLTRNPGGTAIGRAIRAVLLDREFGQMAPMSELLLYAADRAQHVEEVVRPALAAGAVVLCDRFYDSTVAYQGGGRGLPVSLLQNLHALATGNLTPHLTLLLDLPVEVGLKRLQARAEADRIEDEAVLFHERVRATYLALAEGHPERFRVLDARQSPEAVYHAACTHLMDLLDGATDSGDAVSGKAGKV
jgi:dTMP kinase